MEQQTQPTALSKFDAISGKIKVFLEPLKSVTVTDKIQNISATASLKGVKEFQKEIEEQRVAAVAPLNAVVDQINAYAKKLKMPLVLAEGELKEKMAAFAAREKARIDKEVADAKAKADAERAAIEAKERAEAEETARKEKEERQRLEAKQKAEREAQAAAEKKEKAKLSAFGLGVDKEAEAKKKAEQEAKAKAEQEDLERSQAEAAAARQAELERKKAQIELDQRAAEKAAELSKPKNIRTTWHFSVEDVTLVPREYWQISEKAIQAQVDLGVRMIPGVRVYPKDSVVASRS